MANRHYYATSDLEEDLALKLALEASLADAGSAAVGDAPRPSARGSSAQHPAHGSNSYPAPYSGSGNGAVQQPPCGYPVLPVQQQHYPGSSQHPQQQHPRLPPQSTPAAGGRPQQQPQHQQHQPAVGRPQQPPQQPHAQESSSSNGAAKQPFWQKPLKLLDSAVQKMAADTGTQCGGCGKWLGMTSGYVRALDRQWHPQCFRCAGCHQPLTLDGGANTFAVGHDQLPYHEACHKQLFHPVCSVCGHFIPEGPSGHTEWREHPFWRLKQCPSHYADSTVSCCSCGRLQPQADEWASLQDGRHLCLECLDTLVVDSKDAQPLYDEILSFFAHMGMPHPYKAPLLLVEGPVLDEYAHKEGRQQDAEHAPMFSVRGLCVAHVYTSIPSVVRAAGQGLGFGAAPVSSIATRMPRLQQHCSVSALLVMYGLPRLLLGSIVAHELMHAYLRMRHVTGLPLQAEEGLCQLVAMLWLDSQDYWAKQQQQGAYQQRLLSYLGYQIRTDTSEVYGDGFRIAMEKFQMRGLKALVEHVIAHGAWPSWSA